MNHAPHTPKRLEGGGNPFPLVTSFLERYLVQLLSVSCVLS